MDINNILLIIAALLPAVALCIFIFIKDRVEKEPIGLLLLLFGLGAIICFPAAQIETWISAAIDGIFSGFFYEYGGELYMDTMPYRVYTFASNFIGVALIEEGLKFLVMFFVTAKNKNFNSLFDGLIYAVFVSLGFAALENVFYVVELGWQVAVSRALMSVPGHMFFAVIMGYYYSMWHMNETAKAFERQLKGMGLIPPNAVEFSGKQNLTLCLLVPICIHGFYDYCCSYGSPLAITALFVLIIILYVYCFRKIFKLSRIDTDDGTYSRSMVFFKYPYLLETLNSRPVQETVPEQNQYM